MQIFYKIYNKHNALIYKCDSYEVAVKHYLEMKDIARKISISAQEETDITEYFILDNIKEITENQLLDILKRASNLYYNKTLQ